MSGAPIDHDAIKEAVQRSKELAAGSLKRQHDDPESMHYPAKRSNMDMGRPAGVPGAGMDVVVEMVDVPDSCVGLVIGRGGEQISQIQQQSGCRVQMAGESNATGKRECTLQGNKSAVDKAREMIMDVINRAGNRPPPARNGGGYNDGGPQNGGNRGPPAPGGQTTHEMLIPGPKCGLIIGKSGETIKAIQEQTGVKMLLIQDNSEATGAPKPLRISGDPVKVEHARRMVEEILSSREEVTNRYMPYQPRSVGEVIVPRASVGMIIGKGGETIKRLGVESGAKIQFKPDDDPNAPDRCATIQGTPDQITKATQLISDLVNKSGAGTQSEVFFMHVPANKTGLVIGKGGETIKQICGESGAHVELSRDPPPNASEKVFIIKGSGYQIHHAQHIIRIKVGDISPGTPVPAYHGSGGAPTGGDTFGGAYDSMGSAGQWNANNYGQQGGAEWNQYYNQQGQQGAQGGQFQQPAAAQFQQPQQQQSAPAINPQTGQPDYSAQWAEYYRSMGMHEQAQMIEQQLKQGGGGGPAQPAAAPRQQQPSYGAGYHF
ncbi:hypothetical protein L596_020354 [Steinernema carpocapsae]|uniref:K Homology domain-containing protein n=1 Tax=Steinernema carpocapsae TaxID=34508 RepID=A0A4U5MTG8_STECR|nr:hypothetical protein L596_020354 [Steinernema carpocapsae]